MAIVVELPESLAEELDQLAESEHKQRTAYVVDVLWRDVKRNKQRQALELSSGAWNIADHPELAEGGAAYIEKIRSEPDERFEDAIRRNQIP
jgi:metal-responsive CopG/Arc/MetJ family transcriptional regulator